MNHFVTRLEDLQYKVNMLLNCEIGGEVAIHGGLISVLRWKTCITEMEFELGQVKLTVRQRGLDSKL